MVADAWTQGRQWSPWAAEWSVEAWRRAGVAPTLASMTHPSVRTGHRPLLIGLTIGVSLCTGCFGRRSAEPGPDVDFGQPQRDYSISKRGGGDPQPETSTLEAHALLAVPPDRALVRVDVSMKAEAYAGARTDTQSVAQQVVDKIAAVDGCTASIEESMTPHATGTKEWTGSAIVRLDASLEGLNSLGERTARVDACVEPLHSLREAGGETMDRAEIRVGAPWYTLDQPSQHRTALLRAALAPLAEVAELEDTPPQFDALATKCTSEGRVSIVDRSATEIGLTVDLTCANDLRARATPPRPPGADVSPSEATGYD